MSLTVDYDTQQKAENGTLTEEDFTALVARSLPHAWGVIEGLVAKLSGGESIALFDPPSLDERTRGELLRMRASDAMRDATMSYVSNRIGAPVSIGFQNCHKVGIFREGAKDAYREFISMRAQVLAQRPELVDC